MSAKNTLTSFGSIAKSFHWMIACLILAMLALGFFLEDIPSDWQECAYTIHKSTGIIILLLMLLRLGWRWCNIQPAYASTYPLVLRFLAHASHYAIYFVVIAMPISGWIMATAAGKIPHFLGWFYFPMPGITLNEALAGQMFQVHNFLAIVLIVLISLHVLAALFHHFVLGDNVLVRMLPGRNKTKS